MKTIFYTNFWPLRGVSKCFKRFGTVGCVRSWRHTSSIQCCKQPFWSGCHRICSIQNLYGEFKMEIKNEICWIGVTSCQICWRQSCLQCFTREHLEHVEYGDKLRPFKQLHGCGWQTSSCRREAATSRHTCFSIVWSGGGAVSGRVHKHTNTQLKASVGNRSLETRFKSLGQHWATKAFVSEDVKRWGFGEMRVFFFHFEMEIWRFFGQISELSASMLPGESWLWGCEDPALAWSGTVDW